VDKGLRLTRTYGASETCGGCVYNGVPIGNTEIAIIDGRIELSGSVIAEGYLDDPRRTAFSFPEHDGRRWYRTDDTGAMHHGSLAVTGRIDDVIISGGLKVSLAEVESVVRELPGLADSVVVAAPHPEWGEVPVVVGTATMGLKELRREVALRLGPAASPDRMLLIDELPLLPSGKPDRLAIAALALK
jgi:O-succinylbenzoic acid--CoA ligase